MHKGIYFNKQYQQWHARAYRNGKYHHIGRYGSLEEAITQRKRFLDNYQPPESVDTMVKRLSRKYA